MKNEPFVIERTYDAPLASVWKAITDKDQMKQWYFDLKEFKPEVGFEFQFTGGEEGRYYLHLCRVTEVIVNKKLTYSWRYDGYAGNSFVTFELFEEGNKTRLKLTHEGLETFPVDNPDLAKENFAAGWNHIIGTSLKEFVEKDTIKNTMEIDASPERVWDVLTQPGYAKQWGSEFGEGTHVETDWKVGSEVLWKDKDGNIGAKGVVEVNDRPFILKVAFYDDVNSPAGTPIGEYSETYKLAEENGKTILSTEAGLLPIQHVKIHAPLWDKALAKMKAIGEGTNAAR